MKNKKIGIISDTHGLLRKEFIKELKGVNLIIHAGDMGNEDILNELNKISKVISVRGNCDKGNLKKILPFSEMIEFQGKCIYIIHDINTLDIDLKVAGVDIVVVGHSHIACKMEKDNVLFINPGGAGPKRFNLPISIAILYFESNELKIKFKYIKD
ncbi:metallophosphoesterase family protein [Clostridium rectalis]|uniref:metallophosphoesterase family protein n=1 Tax=Clostridium rectalis TaxID=2040295 RepID=UPI000F63CAA5|nr:metallophosphoesterase family protein [Clostridium rectalis]